jgi:hypothetical protein
MPDECYAHSKQGAPKDQWQKYDLTINKEELPKGVTIEP